MSGYYRRTVRTVDSHTAGKPTRVIVSGVPIPPGTLDRLPPMAQVRSVGRPFGLSALVRL